MTAPKNVLILGGYGFIGSNLLDRFLGENGYRLIVFASERAVPKRPEHASRVLAYRGNFSNGADLERVFSENRIDIVIHSISTTVPASSNADMAFDVESNVAGTLRLLEMMRRHHTNRIVYLSSGGTVYGEPSTSPTPEDAPTDPICSYGIGKLAIEKYLRLYRRLHGFRYLILRPSNPYGPYHTSSNQGLINVVIRKAMAGEPVTIWGDGKLVRDYLYAGDLAEAVYQLVDLEHWDRTVNIGYGKGHTVRAILKIVSEFFPSVHVVSNPARAFDIQNLVLDTSLMRSLCHVPLLSLDSGIRRTIEHLMAESGSASLSQTPVSRILQN